MNEQPRLTEPLVAVITPYYRESLDQLEQCHRSVKEQKWPCLHVLVADGIPQDAIHAWDAHHVVLPRAHGDIGSTPRLIGCYHAIGLGVAAVAFLDADNWYHPMHIRGLMEQHHNTGAAFISSSRMLCRLDGSVMAPCPITDADGFIDTNCMLFTKHAFPLLHHWVLMPGYGHLIGDRIMMYHVRRSGLKLSHNPAATVFYRCGKEGLYHQLGEPIPSGVKPKPDYQTSFKNWEKEGNPPLI